MQDTRPCLITDKDTRRPVTLLVYAPLGDPVLSSYPNGRTTTLQDHPLFDNLKRVAQQGVNVVALIDRADAPSYLVEMPAHGEHSIRSQWKQDMSSPIALREFLSYGFAAHEGEAFVLSLQGHGAGYLPTIDATKLSLKDLTVELPHVLDSSIPKDAPIRNDGVVVRPDGTQIRPNGTGGSALYDGGGNPVLGMRDPTAPFGPLPRSAYPISTYELGWALREALAGCSSGPNKLSVVHLNNCFNFSVELLHTIWPHAEFAAGYCNYNFFSGGAAYPWVFEALAKAGTMSTQDLALQFAKTNQRYLDQDPEQRQPTIGSAIALRRMPAVAAALDKLSQTLIDALPAHRAEIVAAIAEALQYDANGELTLEVPDANTDLRSFAQALSRRPLPDAAVAAAKDLDKALADVFVYGTNGSPWMNADGSIKWQFDRPQELAMNVFLPDPALEGDWDWRSPYYLTRQPGALAAQPHVIELLRATAWVPFLRKLHEGIRFKSLRRPFIPTFPQVNPRLFDKHCCPPKAAR
jgi:hypothetical protein